MRVADITLGAAQLGMAYGIANRRGKMTRDEVFEFLEALFASGIERIDTSPAYGDSETLIGEYLRASHRKAQLVTKLPSLGIREPASTRALIPVVERCLSDSLKNLDIETVDDYLLHSEGDFLLHGVELVDALRYWRDRGYAKRIGVSIYTATAAAKARELGVDSVQVPCNILDHRLDSSGFFSAAAQSSIRVFARSIYLQGLLFLPDDEVFRWLPAAIQPLRRFRQLAIDCKRTPAELAFVYLRDKKGVDSMVVGMESREQLDETLALLQAPALSDEEHSLISGLFADVPVEVLNPALWRRE